MKVLHVAGARPNFVKIAPLVAAFESRGIDAPVVHTGQHYDERMSRLFFDDLGIPRPRANLEVGSGSHGAQTALVLERMEEILRREAPDLVVVVGDVNSTAAAALAAVKLGILVAHVEAGLRSFDRTMPEEVNRVVTDAISDLHYCTEEAALRNLAAEGVAGWRAALVGNVMIDTLLRHRDRARALRTRETLGLPAPYALLTLHRPSNVDAQGDAERAVESIVRTARRVPLVFPVHPRTRNAFAGHGLLGRLESAPGVRLVEPLGYLEFLSLLDGARLVLTDSGGVQEETTVLGVPCLTLRNGTERPATVTHGTNRIVGSDPADVDRAVEEALSSAPAPRRPDLWDGRAAERIVEHVLSGVLGRAAAARPAWREVP
jgi:UDP-N-acetylglucosamine 2-epimerase (non-hydrolysing)